jgi:hypothetical protein
MISEWLKTRVVNKPVPPNGRGVGLNTESVGLIVYSAVVEVVT